MITLLIDMDGVLTKDKEFTPFDHAPKFIENLKRSRIPFRIVSNNSTRSPDLIVQKLRMKGFDLRSEDFISPVAVLPDYLKEKNLKRLFVIGTQMLRSFLSEKGFEVRDDHKVDAVVVGQDKEIDFRKIKTAVSAVFLENAKIVPVNLSRIVKDSDGLYFPGRTTQPRKTFPPVHTACPEGPPFGGGVPDKRRHIHGLDGSQGVGYKDSIHDHRQVQGRGA